MSQKSSHSFQADLIENDLLSFTHPNLHELRKLLQAIPHVADSFDNELL